VARLAAIAPEDQGRVSFVAHPSVRLLRAGHPVVRIWRAVLAGDDGPLASLDLDAGPVDLLVERRSAGVEVVRLDEPAWRFLAELCACRPLQETLEQAAEFDSSTALAGHLAAGRFVAFKLNAREPMAPAHEDIALTA